MELPFSTSKVTVEYFDPHGLYKLIAPGLDSRLPLRHLHWQSHSGPLRSIDSLHVELFAASTSLSNASVAPSNAQPADRVSNDPENSNHITPVSSHATNNSNEATYTSASAQPTGKERRHQIPGLRRTPYLKVLLVRCDDSDSYKSQTRQEIREWVKQNTAQASSKKSNSMSENHDAFEWMVVHVVIPNSAAYSQPRTSKLADGSIPDLTLKSTSRWGKSSSTILERMRSDFNTSSSSSGKSQVDRIAQVRVGLDDVPYAMLPRVTSSVPAGYVESERDAQQAWADLIDKFKALILASFDVRVTQYEDDIREKDVQRRLPGWNFCTFFILKEGLALGFESVGLIEDALVVFDELSVGLDTVIEEQQAPSDSAATHTGSLLPFTEELKQIVTNIITGGPCSAQSVDDDESVYLQAGHAPSTHIIFDLSIIPISATKKPYRDMILANNVSVFDFRCYIFARQIGLLLRLGNASLKWDASADPDLKDKDALAGGQPKATDDPENLDILAEICRRTLEFIPSVSQVMRKDLQLAMADALQDSQRDGLSISEPISLHAISNVVSSFAISIAQQILAQTSTKALPIPPLSMTTLTGEDPMAHILEPKAAMLPTRSSSLQIRFTPATVDPPSANPDMFPVPSDPSVIRPPKEETSRFLKLGLEELAARRADLYTLMRNTLEDAAKKLAWESGWGSAPFLGGDSRKKLGDISLDDANTNDYQALPQHVQASLVTSKKHMLAGIQNTILRTALQSKVNFHSLYEILTDKALRHYAIAGYTHVIHSNLADLAVLKLHLGEFASAASYFYKATPFFGENNWSLLELSMLAMYSRCLEELGKRDELVLRLIKLLTKAANAERNRLKQQSSLAYEMHGEGDFFSISETQGYMRRLLHAASQMPTEVRLPLTHLFTNIDMDSVPVFSHGRDSFAVTLRLYSLLADELPSCIVRVRIAQHTRSGGLLREIWLETNALVTLTPGRNKVHLFSNTIVPGLYEVDQIRITSGNVGLFHDRNLSTTEAYDENIIKARHIILYQRTSGLDVRLTTSKNLHLHKSNNLELEILSGWNSILSCDLRVRAASGGLRLLVSEARVLGNTHVLSKPVEVGIISLSAIDKDTSVKIGIPFSMEQDALDLGLRIDVTYTTEHGTFFFAKSPSVSTALALGVNVQDVFKHYAVFSRFTVSTAMASPLRLFRSELIESDIFTSCSGVPPNAPTVVFPKQPASFLYKITRKPSSTLSRTTKRTMYIKLFYTVLMDEIEAQFRASLETAFRNEPPLYELSHTVVACVLHHIRTSLSSLDLERVTQLGEIPTFHIGSVDWATQFPGLGCDDSGAAVADQLAVFIAQWQQSHPLIPIPQPNPAMYDDVRTILIPVDVPSISIVHTADIQLQGPPPSIMPVSMMTSTNDDLRTPMFCVNQLLPATLHLKWTRVWDTGSPEDTSAKNSTDTAPKPEDLEFSFEVTAPTDTWLVGGRRKGHFVIPAPDTDADVGWTSTPECEATIPLMLIPLREGWLPFPVVEIREVVSLSASGSAAQGDLGQGAIEGTRTHNPCSPHHCETDYRNLGETVWVVADRHRVTLSLDASGPGGGPLVLENERTRVDGRIVV